MLIDKPNIGPRLARRRANIDNVTGPIQSTLMDVHVSLKGRGDLSTRIYRQLFDAVLDGRFVLASSATDAGVGASPRRVAEHRGGRLRATGCGGRRGRSYRRGYVRVRRSGGRGPRPTRPRRRRGSSSAFMAVDSGTDAGRAAARPSTTFAWVVPIRTCSRSRRGVGSWLASFGPMPATGRCTVNHAVIVDCAPQSLATSASRAPCGQMPTT